MKTIYSDFLYANPSSVAGVARFFDLAGTYDAYNVSTNETEADCKATFADWAAIGDAFRKAFQQFLNEGR